MGSRFGVDILLFLFILIKFLNVYFCLLEYEFLLESLILVIIRFDDELTWLEISGIFDP